MNETLATYSFFPWLRQGIANSIKEADNDLSVKLRASIPVSLSLKVKKPDDSDATIDAPPQTVHLYGPGDIIGIDSKAIVKVEPLNRITNFEPNYLPYIDFYDEDLPWRYTPAKPVDQRLRPWFCLVVLKDDEFSEGKNIRNKPLPFFTLKNNNAKALFPKSSELWAWAHVHVNTDLLDDADPTVEARNNKGPELKELIDKNPDHAWSRIISPRKLEQNTSYHAFLIPTFESGRLAGLGMELPDTLIATKSAWEDPTNIDFPYYYRWYFRTGNVGDFEYLVNLLKPMPADKSVGVKDMDVLHIGSNLPDIVDDPAETDESKLLHGVLKLGGALRVPLIVPDINSSPEETEYYNEVKKYDEWDENPYPHPFVTGMAKRINLADDYTTDTADTGELNSSAGIPKVKDENNLPVNDPDPVITSPLYGRWHALTQRLMFDRTGNNLSHNKNWIHELNLDPRFRVAAGFGTNVVKKGQEEYMQAAWEQVGDIVEANNKIRLAQMAKEVSLRFHIKHLLPLSTEKSFVFAAPVRKRVIYKELTIHKQIEESTVPLTVTSGSFRSITRPRGRLMKKIAFTPDIHSVNLIGRINEGEVTAAPPKTDPEGAIRLDDVAGEFLPQDIPSWIVKLLMKYPKLKFLSLVILLFLILLALFFLRTASDAGIFAVFLALLYWLYRKMSEWYKAIERSESVQQEGQTPGAVDSMPNSPDFSITEPESGFSPTTGESDSEEAGRFKQGLKDAFTLIAVPFPAPIRHKLNLAEITGSLVSALNPAIAIPKRTLDNLRIPARIQENMVEKFTPVMAYPEIDIPMYKPLADISPELFLPNINKLKDNSITILENNQKFIEGYLAGLNHEMSRELLWREYPTDQRGTCFRQFWDVSGYLPPQPVPPDMKEKLRDIPPMHKWPLMPVTGKPGRNELGRNNQRAQNGEEAQIVLVIRGELLKKYPTAVVYAQKADWGEKNGAQDVQEERVFATLTDQEKKDPPRTKIKTPLFEAKVEPDIYFFGFDLTTTQALGKENPTSTSDDQGWFFIIKERPGELRFGLDIEKAKNENNQEKIINWNNLSWKDVHGPGGTIIQDGECIELNTGISISSDVSTVVEEDKQNSDDIQAAWGPGTNSAELAYILYQVPVLVGIHAWRMLP